MLFLKLKFFNYFCLPPFWDVGPPMAVHMYKAYKFRDVAQPGSAHVWGAWGRKFESCHPDKISLLFAEIFYMLYFFIGGGGVVPIPIGITPTKRSLLFCRNFYIIIFGVVVSFPLKYSQFGYHFSYHLFNSFFVNVYSGVLIILLSFTAYQGDKSSLIGFLSTCISCAGI